MGWINGEVYVRVISMIQSINNSKIIEDNYGNTRRFAALTKLTIIPALWDAVPCILVHLLQL
jgi:hypothetical protein